MYKAPLCQCKVCLILVDHDQRKMKQKKMELGQKTLEHDVGVGVGFSEGVAGNDGVVNHSHRR